MEDAIAKLVEFVEMASPAVWAVAQQQVKVQIFQSAVWVFALAAVVGACIGTGKRAVDVDRQRCDSRRDFCGRDHGLDGVTLGHLSGSVSNKSTNAWGAVTMASCPVAISRTGHPSPRPRLRAP